MHAYFIIGIDIYFKNTMGLQITQQNKILEISKKETNILAKKTWIKKQKNQIWF